MNEENSKSQRIEVAKIAARIDMEAANKDFIPVVNELLGTTAASFDELVDTILPTEVVELKSLALLYEAQMVAAKEARAYYAACVMGAAMVEAIFLMLSILNREKVEQTRAYQRRAGRKGRFEQRVWGLGFDDLIGIADELKWVPEHLIDDEWKRELPEQMKSIVAEGGKQSKDKQEAAAEWARANSAFLLMKLLNVMRDKLHAGKWVRERHQLKSNLAFETWSQVVLVAAAHLRDCLMNAMFEALKVRLTEAIERSVFNKLLYGEDLSGLVERLKASTAKFRTVIPFNTTT